jgi:hypothetical protein
MEVPFTLLLVKAVSSNSVRDGRDECHHFG